VNYKNGRKMGNFWLLFALITFCSVKANASKLPPDPDNAALLYYQAFLHQPEPDYAEEALVFNTHADKIYELLCGGELEFHPDIEKEISELEKSLKNGANGTDEIPSELKEMMPEQDFEWYLFSNIQSRLSELRKRREHEKKMRGVDPNETIRSYMKECRDTIELAQAASELPQCDWGIMYSQGLACRSPQIAQTRPLISMLCTDALVLAADKNYRAAFERCLMARRFAHHVCGDIGILYSVSAGGDYKVLRCIGLILGHMKPDVDTLVWLKNQLAIEKGPPASPAKVLKTEFAMVLQSLRTNSSMMEKARQVMSMRQVLNALEREQLTQDGGNAVDMQSLTDEELIALAGKPYATFLDSVLQVMDSEMSYEEKSSEIRRLTEEITSEFGGDPASFPMMVAQPEKLLTLSVVMFSVEPSAIYNVHVRRTAHSNALIAGIEVHLVKAKTGQLPEKLPEGVPKDPFTGKDFAYEITEEGFVLSLSDKNIPGQKLRAYEFKVKE